MPGEWRAARQAPRVARLVTTSVPLCTNRLRAYCPYIHTVVKRLHAKKNHEMLTAMQYKPLYNINRCEKWSKKYTNRGL